VDLGDVLSSHSRDVVIGLFDSGVGGLSVWQEVVRRMPHQVTMYVADSAHCPYGPRPPEEVRCFSRGIVRFLIEQGAGVVVVACNTASAAALGSLRAEFDVPIVGMEPAVKPAAERTKTGHVGVLATAGTVNGDLFRNTSAHYANGVTVHVGVAKGLVEQVETGQADTPETESLLRIYLQPMIDAGVDQIALGCTHYPFLLPVIRRIVPQGVSVIDPAAAVARQVERVLLQESMVATEACAAAGCYPFPEVPRVVTSPRLRGASYFFTSGQPEVLAAMVCALTGWEPWVERVAWKGEHLYDTVP
jgi:glutamate racemase